MFELLDKMCDQISDAVLDAHLLQDPESKIACETATKSGLIIVFGENHFRSRRRYRVCGQRNGQKNWLRRRK